MFITRSSILNRSTPANTLRQAVGRSIAAAATGRMGNHLVAKLAFFPPDPATYTKQGAARARTVTSRGVFADDRKRVSVHSAAVTNDVYVCSLLQM